MFRRRNHSILLAGYRYFEDQYPTPKEPPKRYEFYEDQVLGATANKTEAPVQKTEHEMLVERHDWKKDKNGRPIPPDNFGWVNEEWGPEPGEEGHDEWYKKPREYMSYEEKMKFDVGIACPVKKDGFRHQELPFHRRMRASYNNLSEEKPIWFSTKDRGYDAPYTYEDKKDHMAAARDEYINEWLEKPGVDHTNIGKKIGDYNGTTKNHATRKVPRKPEWDLAPLPDE